MQPENHVAWTHPFLQTSPCVEPRYLAWPCVAAFDARDTGLANAELSRDSSLRHPFGNACQDGRIALVELLHACPLPTDNFQCPVSFGRLDRNVRPHEKQEAFNVRSVGHRKNVEALALGRRRSPILFDATVSEPVHHFLKRRADGVCEAQAHAAFIRVDLDTPLAVEESGEVASESVVREMGHIHALKMGMQNDHFKLAVPCMAWIGSRIAAHEAELKSRRRTEAA